MSWSSCYYFLKSYVIAVWTPLCYLFSQKHIPRLPWEALHFSLLLTIPLFWDQRCFHVCGVCLFSQVSSWIQDRGRLESVLENCWPTQWENVRQGWPHLTGPLMESRGCNECVSTSQALAPPFWLMKSDNSCLWNLPVRVTIARDWDWPGCHNHKGNP